VVARAGDPDRAEAIARSMTRPGGPARALRAVAEALARAGDLDRAEVIARSITLPDQQAWALAAVAEELARAGNLDRAVIAVRSLIDTSSQAEAVIAVVSVLAEGVALTKPIPQPVQSNSCNCSPGLFLELATTQRYCLSWSRLNRLL
jgi:hypothetical protein